MSERRHDLLNPVVDRRKLVEASAISDLDAATTGERQLAQVVAQLRHDEAALCAWLGDHVQEWQRLTARIVLCRTLGAERARQLCDRAFGFGTVEFSPKPSLSHEPTLGVRYGDAQVQALLETLLRLTNDPVLTNSDLASALLASSPRVIGERAVRNLRGSSRETSRLATARLHHQLALPAGRALARVAERRAATLFRRELDGAIDRTDPDHPRVEEALRRQGSGEPLPDAIRREMEARFGMDFRRVRIHCDRVAEEAARAVNAQAFTVGEDIFFRAGAFSAESVEGQKLLVHELTHVVQAYQGRVAVPSAGATQVSRPIDPLEREAEATAAKLAGSDPAPRDVGLLGSSASHPTSVGGGVVQRKTAATGVDADLHSHTQVPDEAQQQEVDRILNPTNVGGKKKKKKKFIETGFAAEMKAAITKWMNDAYKGAAHLDKGGADVFKLDMTQVRETGKAAQEAVVGKWSAHIKNATFNKDTATSDPKFDVSSAKVLHPQEDTIDTISKPEQDEVVRDLVEYGIRQAEGGKLVATKHHLDPTRAKDRKARDQFIKDFVKEKSNYKKLIEIQRMWPGEEHPWDHTVYIQLRQTKDTDLAKKEKANPKLKDAQLRRGYWGTYQTLIHEFIHACAHANYIKNEGSGSQDQILAEGGDDWLVTQLWAEILPKIPTDAPLRLMVEGKKYDYSADVIPPLTRYDEWKDVDALIKKLGPKGKDNFLAAYFQGHVELLGLGTWKKGMVTDVDTFPVTVAGFPPSQVADRTFVDEATIRAANGLGPADKLPIGPARVPGISWHYCIPQDTLAAIAKQHGVTEAALKRANPGVSWGSLKEGDKILIPKH